MVCFPDYRSMEIMTSLGTDKLDFGSGIKLAVKAVIIYGFHRRHWRKDFWREGY